MKKMIRTFHTPEEEPVNVTLTLQKHVTAEKINKMMTSPLNTGKSSIY